MYVRNKILWLKDNGWDVELIFSENRNVILPELQNFGLFVPEFCFNIYLFGKYYVHNTIKKVIKALNLSNGTSDIIVESVSVPGATWGEVLSESINAKHFVYLINEDLRVDNGKLYDFLKFKLDRKEIASIADKSLVQLFKGVFEINPSESYTLPAHCNNVLGDYASEYDDVITAYKGFRIGCISRLEKPFLIPLCQQLYHYVATRPNKNFLICFIGGSENTSIVDRINKLFAELKNVKLVFTGFMYPISISLVRLFDVFVSSAGSVVVSSKMGIPTIVMDAKDHLPIGVYKETTQNLLYRSDNEPPICLDILLDKVLFEHTYLKKTPEAITFDFISHMEFIYSSSTAKSFYPIESIKTTLRHRLLLKISLNVLGAGFYLKLSYISVH